MTSDDQIKGGRRTLKRRDRSIANSQQVLKDSTRIQKQFTPVGILALTIGGIAFAEVLAMIFVYYFRDRPYAQQVLFDTVIMTVIIFPLLYYLSFRPLLLHIQQRDQADRMYQARLRLMHYTDSHTLDELLQFALDEIEILTGSTISFLHFIEADQKTLWLQAWSTNTLQNMCKAEGKDSHYDLEKAGVWADAARLRRAIIHNDFAALTHRKGMPDGHATVEREMVVPIMRENKVVAILGVGNKPEDFTANDLELVSTFADYAWDVVERKRAEIAIRKSERKFRTLVDWTYDWEKWLDPSGDIVYTSPSCERITGYTPEEFVADPDLLLRIVHPEDQPIYVQHHQLIHSASESPVTIEYRIISRDGSEHWIEHICRPLFGPDDRYLGRRISNREITERKQNEKKMIEQSQKEVMLTQTIQSIQTDIARDLHDTLGQNIGFLRMSLEHLAGSKSGDQADMQIQNMTKAADESYELIRTLLAILQSGYSADPLDLFTRYKNQVAERSAIHIDITSQGHPNQLSPHQIRQIFYIFREALSNIEKYANATRVTGVFLWEERALTFEISDNGGGFDPASVQTKGHYGLKFMRERAELMKGSLSLHSVPGEGTKISVVVPYEHELSSRLHS